MKAAETVVKHQIENIAQPIVFNKMAALDSKILSLIEKGRLFPTGDEVEQKIKSLFDGKETVSFEVLPQSNKNDELDCVVNGKVTTLSFFNLRNSTNTSRPISADFNTETVSIGTWKSKVGKEFPAVILG